MLLVVDIATESFDLWPELKPELLLVPFMRSGELLPKLEHVLGWHS